MNNVDIRAPLSSELPAIFELLVANGWSHRIPDPAWLGQLLANSRSLVAVENGEVIGFARVISDGLSNGYVSMAVIAVGHRRKGIGTRILRALTEAEPGMTWVLRADRPGAQSFFAKLGFRSSACAMERKRKHVGSGSETTRAPPIRTNRFSIRPFHSTDAPSLVAAVQESLDSVGRWMSWAHAGYSLSEAQAWIAHCSNERARASSYEFGIFDADSETLVGACGLNQFNRLNGFCNLGYWVRQSWQRRGAATAAINAITTFGFDELALGRIEIVVASGNEPGLAMAKKSGALLEGIARNRLRIHDLYTDAYVFSLVPTS